MTQTRREFSALLTGAGMSFRRRAFGSILSGVVLAGVSNAQALEIEEASIADIEAAYRDGELTAHQVVAAYLARIKAAGGIILGKASLSEFTNGGGDNINSVLPGFARNPYNTAYATGGSSGGTGASIAASFATVGIGTDTGGSVRMPSAHNALSGLRPTVGLVSRTGIQPNNSE